MQHSLNLLHSEKVKEIVRYEPKRKWTRRIYVLDGKEIDSHSVLGSLHTARKDKREPCVSCMKKIEAGREYIQMLDYDPYIFHKECYLGDIFCGCTNEEKKVLAVGTKKVRRWGHYVLPKTLVICKAFYPKDKGIRH